MIVYYRVRVDKDTIEGKNPIKLRYSLTGGKSWIVLDPFDVRIQTQDAILAVEDVSTNSESCQSNTLGRYIR